MSTDSTRRRQIVASLQDKDYRDAFVAAEISTTVPFQIREMRNDRGWTQAQLADQTGQDQPTMCKFENPDYAQFSITSLKRLAAAFDVALIVKFVPFSELVDQAVSKAPLIVPDYANDARLHVTGDQNIVTAATAQFEYEIVISNSILDNYGGETFDVIIDCPKPEAISGESRLAA